MGDYIVPILFVALILIAAIKKKNPYQCMIEGAKEGFSASFGLFPNIMAIFLALSLMQASGLNDLLSRILSVPMQWLGIPKELAGLVVLRPVSGSGRRACQVRPRQLYRALRNHDSRRLRHGVLYRDHLFRPYKSEKYGEGHCHSVGSVFFELSSRLLAVQNYVKFKLTKSRNTSAKSKRAPEGAPYSTAQ